jgi:hypothetical protein
MQHGQQMYDVQVPLQAAAAAAAAAAAWQAFNCYFGLTPASIAVWQRKTLTRAVVCKAAVDAGCAIVELAGRTHCISKQ